MLHAKKKPHMTTTGVVTFFLFFIQKTSLVIKFAHCVKEVYIDFSQVLNNSYLFSHCNVLYNAIIEIKTTVS